MHPVILLNNPKHPANLGNAIRTAACFDVSTIRYTGTRMQRQLQTSDRIPREMRMREYSHVDYQHNERPFDEFPDLIPVAVEFQDSAELLTTFQHPKNAMYVFGPEDGNIAKVFRMKCERFVVIPTNFCLNITTAISIILYDRMLKNA